MIVRCFSCSTRFLVSQDDLGDGRHVRCGKCSYTWFQEPAKDTAAPDLRPSIRPVTGQLPRKINKQVPKTLWYLAATAWLLLIICLAFLFGFRQQVVSVWEPANRLYSVVGLSVPVPGEGLVLSNITSKSYTPENEKPMVVITGQVVNTTSQTRIVPMITLELRDKAKRSLATWTLQPPAKQLTAGQSIDFFTQKPVENALVSNVFVRFAAKE
jgi:predicted Zn finger-like uncharacterized protein